MGVTGVTAAGGVASVVVVGVPFTFTVTSAVTRQRYWPTVLVL